MEALISLSPGYNLIKLSEKEINPWIHQWYKNFIPRYFHYLNSNITYKLMLDID